MIFQRVKLQIKLFKLHVRVSSGGPFTSGRNQLLQSKWSLGEQHIAWGTNFSRVNELGDNLIQGPIYFVTARIIWSSSIEQVLLQSETYIKTCGLIKGEEVYLNGAY